MKRTLRNLLNDLHRQQSGAVMLLMLAAFLILFMLALVLYDAGHAARDKMTTQVAADTSAFAHSNVKARGMNMIVYGNIIKRMFYAYMHTYASGWSALQNAIGVDGLLCYEANLKACERFGKEMGVLAAEIAEAPSNIGALISEDGRSQRELAAIEATQSYLAAITPWWAWVENFTRAHQNGAFVTMTWPPPSSRITAVKKWINRGASAADKMLDTDLLHALPSNTYRTDKLPVVRRDKDALIEAWGVKANSGKFLAHASYCDNYQFSYEALTLQAQYLVESTDIITMKGFFAFLAMGTSVGCAVAGLVYKGDVLDWKIEGGHFGRPGRNAIGGALAGTNDDAVSDEWLSKTSNLTIAYKPRAGQMSDDDGSGRGKFGFVSKDYRGVGASALYRNSGYWSIARSEVAFVPQGVLAGLSGMFSGVSGFPGLKKFIDTTFRSPDMWTPAWTGRLRPAVLPDEAIATSTAGETIGLDAMFWDSAAYLLMAGGMMGAVDTLTGDPQVDLDDAARDVLFLLQATEGYGPDEMEGITK